MKPRSVRTRKKSDLGGIEICGVICGSAVRTVSASVANEQYVRHCWSSGAMRRTMHRKAYKGKLRLDGGRHLMAGGIGAQA